ncbi:MAG: Trk system potassium transporter TrkA [Planctomycetes bacterium]|jgi:trk system potassium uptake protein TrkA|nr:Trk system potassium transporter TrkA [Planctomycetota bacterium]MCP4839006.1 Trk system potassium transporter TrkA [Planctomycetota bacterium]
MDIILCGGGDIGGAAAEMLTGRGDSVTVIDQDESRLNYLEEHFDIAVVEGSASSASTLRAAGAATADAVIATTDIDEVNLVICDIAACLGAQRTLARVDHSMFLLDEELDYAAVFSVDRLFSPDRAMASGMASRLHNPAAIAIEHFAGSGIELQQVEVNSRAPAIGQPLKSLGLPRGARLAAVTRHGKAFLPSAETAVEAEDIVTLVSERKVLQAAKQFFCAGGYGRQNIAISGGPAAAVWLCRFLGKRNFDIRLFESDLSRAEVLGEKLDWITVIQSDPGQPEVFNDEHLDRVDAFVSMRSDEQNMLACAYARRCGVEVVMPVIRHAEFEPLMQELGIHHTWNPRQAAAQAISRALHCHAYERIEGFFNDTLELMRIRVGHAAPLINRTLVELDREPPLLVLACEDEDGKAFVPGGDMRIIAGRHMIVLTTASDAVAIRTLLDAGAAL